MGGPRGTLLAITLLLLLSLVIWIFIIIRSKYIKTLTVNEYETVYNNVLFMDKGDIDTQN